MITRHRSASRSSLEIEPFELSVVNNIEKMSAFLDDVGHKAVVPISICLISSWRRTPPNGFNNSAGESRMSIFPTAMVRNMAICRRAGDASTSLHISPL